MIIELYQLVLFDVVLKYVMRIPHESDCMVVVSMKLDADR